MSGIGFNRSLPCDYIVADATARAALEGMTAKQVCLQIDTKVMYIYDGSAWYQYITLG